MELSGKTAQAFLPRWEGVRERGIIISQPSPIEREGEFKLRVILRRSAAPGGKNGR
jgi:hypothetical protein